MNTHDNKPAVAESPSSIWTTALVMLACLAAVTALKSIPSLAGVPKGIFWSLYALPILLCLWSHLHLNRNGKALFFLLFPIFLVAAVMILCLLPDGLFAWTIR
ncbi:MAG: hypothetical protein ACKOS8_08525 [Gemmataceae bacterium]